MGFRTPSGVVTAIQSFKTMEIPRQVRGKPGAWNPLVCLEFGDTFFRRIKEVVTTVDDSSVWRASFSPGVGVSVRLLDKAQVTEVINGEDRVGFLPRWYWDDLIAARGKAKLSASHVAEAQPSSASPSSSRAPVPISPPPATHAGWQI